MLQDWRRTVAFFWCYQLPAVSIKKNFNVQNSSLITICHVFTPIFCFTNMQSTSSLYLFWLYGIIIAGTHPCCGHPYCCTHIISYIQTENWSHSQGLHRFPSYFLLPSPEHFTSSPKAKEGACSLEQEESFNICVDTECPLPPFRFLLKNNFCCGVYRKINICTMTKLCGSWGIVYVITEQN